MRASSTVLLAFLACSAGAHALESGDIILRAGVAQVRPDATNNTVLPGVDVGKDTQLGLTGTYMINPVFGVQLLASTPFKHDITIGGVDHASTKQLPPTVTLQWYPAVSDKVHPYVGAGVNYTKFFGTKNDLGVNLKLSDSVGLALEAGVDVNLTNKLLLNLAVWKVNISTDVKVNGVKQGSVDIDPLAVMIGVGYKL